jgi:hypothetical protein
MYIISCVSAFKFYKRIRHVCLSLQNVSKSHFEFYLFLQQTKSYLRLLPYCVHRQKHLLYIYIIFTPCLCMVYIVYRFDPVLFSQWKKMKFGYINLYEKVYWLIDWLVLNANISSISAILWGVQEYVNMNLTPLF